MFFALSKVLGFFAIPSNLVLAVGLIGIALAATRFAAMGRRLAFASLIAFAILGLGPVGNALIIPLEERFPPWIESAAAPAGIVVLGGSLSPHVSGGRGEAALNEAAERLTAAVELARRFPDARVVFSGGDATLLHRDGVEAELAMGFFERQGLSRERILLETRSRNTVENAILSKVLAQPAAGERWLLVTSAYHMPRAVGVFRKAGFAVEPFPVDWRTVGPADSFRPFPAVSDGLRRTDTAVREWIGLFAYWLTGRSSELFPGPAPPPRD
jgi:uncharacterized SAM-binding protein YcdF (DUF218 family)